MTRAMMSNPFAENPELMEFYPLKESDMKLVEDKQYCMGLDEKEMEKMKEASK